MCKRYQVGGFLKNGNNVGIGGYDTLAEAQEWLKEMPKIFIKLASASIWDDEKGETIEEIEA